MSTVTDELRQEVRRLRGVVREQGETIERQSERIDELERENDENDEKAEKDAQELVEVRTDGDDENPTLKDIWIAGLPFGNIIDRIEATINGPGRIKDRIDDLEAGTAQTDEPADDERSPLAQLIDLPREKASEVLSENQDRGCRIAQRAKELGTKTPEGLVVRSSDIADQLRKWGESTHSETVSRVMEFIVDLGKDDVRSTMHKGRRILVFDPDRVNGYGNGTEPDVIKSRRDVIWSRESGANPALA